MTIVLVARTFVAFVRISLQVIMREFSLNAIADLDDGEIGGSLQNSARNQIANATRKFFIDRLTTRITHNGTDNILSVKRRNATYVIGRYVALFELSIFASFLIGLTNGYKLVYINLARITVDSNTSIIFEIKNALIAISQGSFQALDEVKLIDLTLMSQRLQGFNQFRCCHGKKSFLPAEINSTDNVRLLNMRIRQRFLDAINIDKNVFIAHTAKLASPLCPALVRLSKS